MGLLDRSRGEPSPAPEQDPDGERPPDGGRPASEPAGERPLGLAGSRMDIRREKEPDRKKWILIGLGVVAVAALTVFFANLDPAAPSVDREVLLFGDVERGAFVREVRGPGTLVPEEIYYVSALSGGRVDDVQVEPGEAVQAGQLLVVLSNPDVQLEALQAQQQLTAARAQLVELRRNMRTQLLEQRSAVATTRAEYEEARRQAESDSALVSRQLISRNEAQRTRESAEALRIRLETEEERLALLEESSREQIEVQEEQVQRLGSIYEYQDRRVESMRVTSPVDGILQDLSLEVGQWVQPGTSLSRVAKPGRLKAELRIPETQARDVQIGQSVVVDMRNDSVGGQVQRIDPNVQNGSVLVEVAITDELPPGARPDLSVDGTVQIERLDDVLHVERPAYAQAHGTASVFRVLDGDDEAVRRTVRFGRASVNRIEILEGLEAGDRIILSDMSRWDDTDRVRIR